MQRDYKDAVEAAADTVQDVVFDLCMAFYKQDAQLMRYVLAAKELNEWGGLLLVIASTARSASWCLPTMTGLALLFLYFCFIPFCCSVVFILIMQTFESAFSADV